MGLVDKMSHYSAEPIEMTAAFPAAMRFGIDEPGRFEGEIIDLEVSEGEIPRDLAGLFTQAVPDYFYPPVTEKLYPMDAAAGGDGVVRALRFADGRADFTTRYVRTERYLAQRAAGRGLFGGYRNPFTDDPQGMSVERTTGNTMINYHAGVLLACKEDGPAYAVDPLTLETLGIWRAKGNAITSRTFSAHPKFDPATGEMFAFGYFAKGVGSRDIAYYVVDAHGRVKHEAWFEEPAACMIHDCAVTPNYFLLPVMPYSTDLERIKAGESFWAYDPGQEMLIGLLPRYGRAQDVRWLRGPSATVLSHTVNAFEQDGMIKFDVLWAEGNVFGAVVPDRKGGNAGPPLSAKTFMVRFTIDPHSKSDQLPPPEVLAEVRGEGAHIDERWALKSHRYVWLPEIANASLPPPALPSDDPVSAFPGPGARPPGDKKSNAPVMFNAISYFDLVTKKKAQWFAGEGSIVQDPVFCLRSPDAPEGEGYIIGVRNWVESRRADVYILNAQKVEAGPIAVLQIPVPLRHGVHSSWTPAYRLNNR